MAWDRIRINIVSPISRYLFHFQLDFDIGNLPALLFVKLPHPLSNLYSKSGPILQVRSYITILISCSQGTNLTVNAAQWGHSICCMDGAVYEEWKAAIKFSQWNSHEKHKEKKTPHSILMTQKSIVAAFVNSPFS